MKNLYLLFLLVFVFITCDDFLKENPKSQIMTDTFFKNSADAYSAVNILYRKGVPSFYSAAVNGASNHMWGGFLAGLFDNQYKGEDINRAHNVNVDANLDNSKLQGLWQSCYEVIVRNANFAIKYIPDCPGLSENERNQLLAEAKFFRALNYFYLVKMFGSVPVITEPYQSLKDIYVRRSSESAVYELIVSDLTEAIDKGKLPDKPMPSNGFRVSKGSLMALLADVYLNMAGYPLEDNSKYQSAAQVARSVINNPNYELIQHIDMAENSAFNILRRSDNEKEYLYTVEYDNIISPGGGYPMYCFSQDASSWGEFRYGMCNLAYDPVDLLHSLYDVNDDLRYQDNQYFHRQYTQVKGTNKGVVRRFARPFPFFWFEEEAALETGVSTKDKVHYRLTELYFIAAESIARTEGVTQEAAGYLASIQARASISRSFNQIRTDLMSLTVDEFVQEVWREKIREMIFECKIWNDITRTRMYPATGEGIKLSFVPLIGATNPFGGTYTADKIYMPICSQELQRNPELSKEPL
jgi:hypothetical protein